MKTLFRTVLQSLASDGSTQVLSEVRSLKVVLLPRRTKQQDPSTTAATAVGSVPMTTAASSGSVCSSKDNQHGWLNTDEDATEWGSPRFPHTLSIAGMTKSWAYLL
jgi:hypothetical protein